MSIIRHFNLNADLVDLKDKDCSSNSFTEWNEENHETNNIENKIKKNDIHTTQGLYATI